MLSEAQLELLVRTDEDLRQESIAIPFRPFHAVGRFAKHYGIEINASDSLAEAIQSWYADHYGNRLRGVTLLGRLPLQLRGDVHILLLAPRVEKTASGEVRPSLIGSVPH